jgi:Rad3-related DNA helicase
VRAKTGSGKTLAYCLPLLQKIILAKDSNPKDHVVRAVILVPTRELCMQVHKTLQTLVYYCNDIISLAVLSAARGKTEKALQDLARQQAMLRDRPDVIVATPAGLLTHLQAGDVDLKTSVETLVVDEADLVLSFGECQVNSSWSFWKRERESSSSSLSVLTHILLLLLLLFNDRLLEWCFRDYEVLAQDLSGISHVRNTLSRIEFIEKDCIAFTGCAQAGTGWSQASKRRVDAVLLAATKEG